jgi:hypothetical protein
MTLVDTTTRLLANNLQIAAPVVALAVSWVLYGVLGKRFLGADDDYWPWLRSIILPIVHRLGMTSGLYATYQQHESEFVGIVAMGEEAFEEELEAAGYYRNPLAALKRSPHGWKSDGSWARRYGRIRWLGEVLRSIDVPIAGRIGTILGRFLQAAGDVGARRQVHVTIYTQTQADTGETRIWLYAHDEPNSLNPLTAWKHYVGIGQSHEQGIRKVREMLDRRGIDYPLP